MTPPQPTSPCDPGQDPFRWAHLDRAAAYDDFHDPFASFTSQRQYAQEHGIPRSTLGSWLRQDDPEGVDPHLVTFLRSSSGLAFLRRLVLALFLVFLFRGGRGLRSLGLFLRLSHLDRFVASSHGALDDLAQTLQADLTAFAAEERTQLAKGMVRKDIALIGDEHFHAGDPCLVAIEPVSNFILVEQYAK